MDCSLRQHHRQCRRDCFIHTFFVNSERPCVLSIKRVIRTQLVTVIWIVLETKHTCIYGSSIECRGLAKYLPNSHDPVTSQAGARSTQNPEIGLSTLPRRGCCACIRHLFSVPSSLLILSYCLTVCLCKVRHKICQITTLLCKNGRPRHKSTEIV